MYSRMYQTYSLECNMHKHLTLGMAICRLGPGFSKLKPTLFKQSPDPSKAGLGLGLDGPELFKLIIKYFLN